MTLATQLVQFFGNSDLTGTITAFVLSAPQGRRDKRYGLCMYMLATILASEAGEGHDSTASVEDAIAALTDDDIHNIALATMGNYCVGRPDDRQKHIQNRVKSFHSAWAKIDCNPVATVQAANTHWLRSNPDATPADAGMFSRSASRNGITTAEVDYDDDQF
jgi:hypothetical protein